MCGVIFPSLPGQCDIPTLNMANFQLDDPLVTKLNKKNKKTWSIFKDHFQELNLKLLCNASCTSLPNQSNFVDFTKANFSLISTPGSKTS